MIICQEITNDLFTIFSLKDQSNKNQQQSTSIPFCRKLYVAKAMRLRMFPRCAEGDLRPKHVLHCPSQHLHSEISPVGETQPNPPGVRQRVSTGRQVHAGWFAVVGECDTGWFGDVGKSVDSCGMLTD